VKAGSIATGKPTTSTDPLFGRPADVEFDLLEGLAEAAHGAALTERRDRAMEMWTKAGNCQDLFERKAIARQWPYIEFDVDHGGIESLLVPTSIRLDCNGSTTADGIGAAQAQAGGEIQLFE